MSASVPLLSVGASHAQANVRLHLWGGIGGNLQFPAEPSVHPSSLASYGLSCQSIESLLRQLMWDVGP